MSDRLFAGQSMTADAPLISAHGLYAAYLQDDANLVLCHTTHGAADLSRPYWSVFANAAGLVSGSAAGPFYAVMGSDGNFVLYGGHPGSPGTPYWATGTGQASGQFTAIIRDDGSFVVYQGTISGEPGYPGPTPIWTSKPSLTRSNRLTAGQSMATDAPLISANGLYAAYLQDDANLVLCYTTNGAADLSRPYWSVFSNAAGLVSGPRTGPGYYAVMRSDGNFVLCNGSGPGSLGTPYWATGPSQAPGQAPGQFTAIIDDSGDFVVYLGLVTGAPGKLGYPLWDSGWPLTSIYGISSRCRELHQECLTNADCCEPLYCSAGVCVDILPS